MHTRIKYDDLAIITLMDIKNYCYVEETKNLYEFFERIANVSKTKEVVFLCVGSSKIWYDCFGPMFGSLLKYLDIDKFVYGNLAANITAKNLQEYIDMIYRFHISPYIVVIDNSLCLSDGRGLYFGEGAITCGAYSGTPATVGDAHICYGLSKNEIKDSSNYYKFCRAIKRAARMLYYTLKSVKNKNKNVKNLTNLHNILHLKF